MIDQYKCEALRLVLSEVRKLKSTYEAQALESRSRARDEIGASCHYNHAFLAVGGLHACLCVEQFLERELEAREFHIDMMLEGMHDAFSEDLV